MTIDDLKAYGANVEEGLGRCMGKEDFYLKLVSMVREDPGFDKLKAALDAHNLDDAFEAAHALKGVLGNVSLTPLYKPVSEISDLLKKRVDMDYSDLLETIFEARSKFMEL